MLYVPDVQTEQTRSLDAVPPEAAVPAGQFVHGEQLVAFVPVLNVPDAQGVQTRSLVIVPPEAVVPAGHDVHGTQVVALVVDV